MNLYRLKRKVCDPTYDCYDGFIVASKLAKSARVIASTNFGDEGREVWLGSDSTCEKIGTALKGIKEGIILADFHAG